MADRQLPSSFDGPTHVQVVTLQEPEDRGQKVFFLEKEPAEVVNLCSFVQPQASTQALVYMKQQYNFDIDKDIVDTIIGKMLFDPSDDCDGNPTEMTPTKASMTRTNALKIFELKEEDDMYMVTIKSMLKMNMIVKFIAIGVSFRQASKIYQTVKEETRMGCLGTASNGEVAQKCRIICAINLQYMKEMFENVWAFAIGLDAGNNAGSSYVDVQVRCYFKGYIQNFHMLATPMRERHTGEYQFDLVVKILKVLAPNWNYQLIGISTDGASAMTGASQGTCTRIVRECYAGVYRIWCNSLTSMTGHLRRQQNLIAEMKSTCPTWASTRWISMGKVLKWMQENCLRLLQHFADK
jgi:hypothetical protein